MNVFDVIPGDSSVVLAQPHGGTFVPEDLMARLNGTGRAMADTDWHIGRLYDGLLEGATVVRSNVHRYVIDANRDSAGQSLYPGKNTTDLCPTTDFDGQPIWQPRQEPSADEIAARTAAYHAPYHAALAQELERVRARHGVVVLYDCHSIRSRIPFLFEGQLPVFNIGTNDGTTCASLAERTVVKRSEAAGPEMDTVVNGRFKGGWTTRHYGWPDLGQHAIQMELAQRAYMTEAAPWGYRADLADALRKVLGDILQDLDVQARDGNFDPKGQDDA
jgi:formiminoglutamase